MTIGERVKKLCRESKISADALEKKLGFGGGYISKLDKSSPNVANMQLIANYFCVSLDYLVNGNEDYLEKYKDDVTHLYAKIRNDTDLSKALMKYFKMSDEKKKHIVELINLLGEEV